MNINKLRKKNLEDFSNQEMDEDFKGAVLGGRNIFLTGPAGTGKSFNIRKLKFLREAGLKVAYTATTGVAALNIGGQTIHRFSGIGICSSPDQIDQITRKKHQWDKAQKRINEIDILVIDEISMLRGGAFDLLNEVFKEARDDESPFGGVQLILAGDFFQLAPVVAKYERIGNPWIFASMSWKECDIQIIKLSKIYRQHEELLINSLSSIRIGRVTNKIDELIESCTGRELKNNPVYLSSINKQVDLINQNEMAKIDSKLMKFPIRVEAGSAYRTEQIYKDLGRREASLKVGCRVMTNVNHPEGLFVNGTLGTVIKLQKDRIKIELDDESEIDVVEHVREIKDHNGKTIEKIKEMPVKLAWAMTIHKSQGATIDCVEIDFRDIFAPSQAYVALSRVSTLAGLRVKNWDKSKVFVDGRVSMFYFSG